LAIEYASVSILKKEDAKIIKGSLSEKNGKYKITQLNIGNYSLKIVSIGYDDSIVDFSISGKNDEIVLNVKMNTSNKVLNEVVINGKPVLADAQTILSQIPANTLENIELITAPSSKYEADGKAGIINIITKKGATDGTSLQVNLLAGLPSTTDYNNLEEPIRFGGDFTLNFKEKKMGYIA
jgi:ferric enterobactin receptor